LLGYIFTGLHRLSNFATPLYYSAAKLLETSGLSGALIAYELTVSEGGLKTKLKQLTQ
jgi:hypothetical protein